MGLSEWGDRQEIQRQVKAKLDAATTEKDKRSLKEALTTYLNHREAELEKEGGRDSLSYKREAKIVLDLINAYNLFTASREIQDFHAVAKPVVAPSPQSAAPPAQPRTHVFCTSCGSKNPSDSKFCFQCGKQLVQIS